MVTFKAININDVKKLKSVIGGIMTYVSVKHKVRDYKAWKSVFDNFEETRKSAGEK